VLLASSADDLFALEARNKSSEMQKKPIILRSLLIEATPYE